MSINKWRLWAPKASALSHPTGHSLFSFFLFFFFFFFLSSLLFFLSLFFFIYSSFCFSSEQKAHTHRTLTRTAFFLLSFDSVFFLFCSFCSSPTDHSHANPSQEIIGVDLRSHAEKLHHALILLIAIIVLVLRSGWSIEIGIYSNGGSPLETIGNDSIWKLCCWRQEQLRWKLVFDLEAFFFFFFPRGVP